MSEESLPSITLLLQHAQVGDRAALDELLPLVYKELKRIAARQLANERQNHTLQATALVHEAYLRLIDQHSVDWRNRSHFFSIAAEMMRRILVNHAINRRAQKRGSGETLLSIDEVVRFPNKQNLDLISLDEALNRLAEFDPVQAAMYAEAEQLHRRSVELAESLRRDFPQNEAYSRFVAATSTNLGTAMARVGRGNEGVPYILRSLSTMLAISESDPDNNEAKRDIAEQWQYMAFARDAMNQKNEAIEANRKSLKILEEVTANDPSNFEFLKQTHLIYNNTGDIFLREGKLAEALVYYQKGMAYAARMSAVNDSSQITVLRSESNRKIGEAYLSIAAENKKTDAMTEARSHLIKAHEDLLALKKRNELGKNYEHRLDLIERDLDKTA